MSRKMIDYNINDDGYVDKIDGRELKGSDADYVAYIEKQFSIDATTWTANTAVSITRNISYPDDVDGSKVKFLEPVDHCYFITWNSVPLMIFINSVVTGTRTAFTVTLNIMPLASGTTSTIYWKPSIRAVIKR